MNRDAAKAPNVEGDWQSIEIFLFSNGQQYSPPRKYLLRVDELNLWDATLNHLAQSHYGLQSPLIDLYTTNGQLVRGPLDLKDGQAYVAVVPPDTFVDAGYQKYLMKASRSWEKRQAKKFPPECVLGEPCCLCPERQRSCCDPQACCLCPEREDAESQEQLLSASEYMDLGPPSGHFVSSAPTKSVAADDNEPVSGKIACATCGHVIRPDEIEYLPVQGPAKADGFEARHNANMVTPSEYEARSVENATRLCENGPRLSEIAARLAENGAGPRKYETTPSVNGTKPGEYKTKPSFNGAKPGEHGAKTNVNVTRPDEYDTKPSVNGAKPAEHGVRPGENVTRPAEYGFTKQGEYKTRPTVNETRPGELEARPGEYETRPGEYGAKPDEYESTPSVKGAKPGDFGASPGDYGAKLGEYERRTSVTGAKPGEYETRTSVNGAKPGEYRAKPGEFETKTSANRAKPVGYGPKPDEYETKTNINGARPLEYEAKLEEYETKTSANGVKPGEFGPRLLEYDTRPSVNGGKLGEYGARPGEYETSPGVIGSKSGEYGATPSLNGAKLGEYETKPSLNGATLGEYETRPSLNGAKLGEYETIPSLNGAKLGEYETRPSLNGAKLGEYETRPSLNGAKPGAYETRPSLNRDKPSEYKTSPSLNGTRPGEYETKTNINGAKPGTIGARPDDCATRSSEQEYKPDENGPSPVKKGAWSGENGDRTASHKVRPGHSGSRSSKIEPIKKAYEVALHKTKKSFDESDRPDKDTAEKDASIKSDFPKQDSTLGPIGENKLEKKGQYRTREGDQRSKEIELKDRSSGNGKKGGERRVSSVEKNIRANDTVAGQVESRVRKIENAPKLSRRGGAEIEQGGRTGEPTRAFEHGSRVSEQKGRETNPAGRAGGQGVREYETRLGAQTNKQSDNLARLGGHESRVGDHEARAGDLGLGTSGHDTGLENPVSREAEPDARAAVSGSRASPKDRMSSRPKNNLGLPKIGTTGTRVDEPMARLDDSDIKNIEGNPETRQSRVRGTEAARALHISEAQHHARRNSLSAGRATIEKKRLSIGQNSTPLRKPTPNSTILRKTEDKQPVTTNKENLPKKINEKPSAIPIPASNDSGKSRTQRMAPLALPPTTISTTEQIANTTNKASPENAVDVPVVLTHSFKNLASETGSLRLDSDKNVVDTIEYSPAETQTELIYIEKSMVNGSVNEEVQTDTESVEQHGKEVTASNKEKTNSRTCGLCKQLYRRVDPDENDENTLSMLNRGGSVNIKLNIQVRNIVKPVCSCQKDCGRSQSLTNITRPEKESQISFDNDMVVNRTSLLSLFNKQNFRGFDFEGSPKVMVVQCAGCGRLNNQPRSDPPPCCDNNKKYFVLLANSVLEDMEDGCNFTPPCRPCDQRHSRKQSSGIPIAQAFSETILDTITTVTVSGMPLQRREMGKCVTNASCQTEEPQSECGIAKRKVSITEDSVTKCDLQKKSNSSVCITTQPVNLVLKQSCRKECSQKCERENSQTCSELCRVVCPPASENVEAIHSPSCEKVEAKAVCSQVLPQKCQKVEAVCSELSPPTCKIVEVVCLQVRPPTCEKECSQVSSQAFPHVQSTGCQQASPQVQSQGCKPSPTYPPCCLKLQPPCTQVQTQVCPCQGPQVCNAETQTRWASILARLHCDGRYSFHLPPLYLLKNNNSCCQ